MRDFAFLLLLVSLIFQVFELCASLNDEGRVLLRFRESIDVDPYGALSNWKEEGKEEKKINYCSWFGVFCSDDSRVVALNLPNLGLQGIISPQIGNLIHLKILDLSNNSFYGVIPREIGELKQMVILDLRNNGLSGTLPSHLSNILSLKLLLIKGNQFSDNLPPNLLPLISISEIIDNNNSQIPPKKYLKPTKTLNPNLTNPTKTINPNPIKPTKTQNPNPIKPTKPTKTLNPNTIETLTTKPVKTLNPNPIKPIKTLNPNPIKPSKTLNPKPTESSRRALQDASNSPSPSVPKAATSPPNSLLQPATPTATQNPPQQTLTPPSLPSQSPPSNAESATKKSGVFLVILVPVVGVFAILAAGLVLYFVCFRSKSVNIAPWATGLSGPITRAFVAGVPSLGRLELDAACEDFSNIITNLEDCKIYKGTLSSGVEIAVVSTIATSAIEWSGLDEDQFRLKISNLSKINHKNFMNLLGYSKVDQPFTRMLVVEYAPNGSLFEHLHIKEAEQLDWPARLRISMGIIYCLEHIENLDFPNPLRTLTSSTVFLSEDYAAKVSDLKFRTDKTTKSKKPDKSPDHNSAQEEPIIYKYAILLLEIISGRLPFSEDTGLLVLWASSYLNGKRELMDMVDPSLEGKVERESLASICEVIRACINPNFEERPKVGDVAKWMRGISRVSPEMAIPRNSPLWWAELEIVSSECCENENE